MIFTLIRNSFNLSVSAPFSVARSNLVSSLSDLDHVSVINALVTGCIKIDADNSVIETPNEAICSISEYMAVIWLSDF